MKRLAHIASLPKFLRWAALVIGLFSVAIFVLCCGVQVRGHFASDALWWEAFGNAGVGYNGPLLEAEVLHDDGRIRFGWYHRGPFPLRSLLILKDRLWRFEHGARERGFTRSYKPAGTLGFA